MEMQQHQPSKRPRPLFIPTFLTPPPPERLEKVQIREASLYYSPRPSIREENGLEAAPERAAAGPPSVQARVSFPDRAHHYGDHSASIGRQDTSGGGSSILPVPSGFLRVPLSRRNAIYLVKSLSRAPVWRAWLPHYTALTTALI